MVPAAAPASAEQGGHRQTRAASSAFDAAAASLAVSRSSHALRRWWTLTQRIKEGDCKPVHVDGPWMPADFHTNEGMISVPSESEPPTTTWL